MNQDDRTLRWLLKPVERWLTDEKTTDFCVNGPRHAFVKQGGAWAMVDTPYDLDDLEDLGHHSAGFRRRDLNRGQPICGTASPWGHRVHIVQRPCVLPGAYSWTARRPPSWEPTTEALKGKGAYDLSKARKPLKGRLLEEAARLKRRGDTMDLLAFGARNGLTMGASGLMGAAKAQPLTSRVLTPTGWRLMGDLKIGDLVLCPDGKHAPITGVFPQGEKETFRVTFEDGRAVECCGEHLWKVWDFIPQMEPRRPNVARKALLVKDFWRVKTLNEIKGWMDRGLRKAKLAAVPLSDPFALEQPPQELPIAPYALGALIGDGSLLGSAKITTADPFVLERVMADIPEYDAIPTGANRGLDFRLKMRGRRGGRMYPSPLLQALRALCLFGLRSHEKFVPDVYKRGSIAQRMALMQGLMDTDGTVGRHGTGASFSTTSERLALDVQELAWSLGAIAKIASQQTYYTSTKRIRTAGKLSWRVQIIHPDVSGFFSLPRKVERCRSKTMRHRLRISAIENVGTKTAQCIMVDHPDHLYITDGFVVTHNTTVMRAAFRNVRDDVRVASIEDEEEARLRQPNKAELLYTNEEGQSEATVGAQDLMQSILRMSIEQAFIQEIRNGRAALAFLRLAATLPTVTTNHGDSCHGFFETTRLQIKTDPIGAHMDDGDIFATLNNTMDIVVHCYRDRETNEYGIDDAWVRGVDPPMEIRRKPLDAVPARDMEDA